MKVKLKYSVLLLIIVLFLAVKGNSQSNPKLNPETASLDSTREEIPIEINYDNNYLTPLIELTVNGQKIKAVFDSGSYGLRILNGALKDNTPDSNAQYVSYSYGDGSHKLNMRGYVKSASVGLGKIKPANHIRIMCIDSTRYGPNAEWTPTIDSTRIQSNHFRSVAAIVGVGLKITRQGKGVANPIVQMITSGKYIVNFPHFGSTKGKVILNPDTVDLKGFTMIKLERDSTLLPNGDSSWRDNRLAGCITINDAVACQNTMLDTGDPDIHIYSKEFIDSKPVTKGNTIMLMVKTKPNSIPIQYSFVIGIRREKGRDYVYLDGTNGPGKNIFGDPFFFNFDVLYDQVNGYIGIRKK